MYSKVITNVLAFVVDSHSRQVRMAESELFRKVFESMTIPAYIVDAELRLVYANRLAGDFVAGTGGDRNAVMGRDLWDVAPFLPSRLREAYRHIIQTGQGSSEKLTIEYHGKSLHADVRRFPIFDGDTVTHIGVIFEDITELKRTQEALRNSEETARALMNSSTESMFLIDEHERLIAANTTGAERLGLSTRDLEGSDPDQAMSIMPPEARHKRRDYYRQVMKSGKPLRFTDERMGRIFDISMFPVADSSGVARRVAVYARDVTEYESMLKALGESEERFRRAFESIPVPTYVWQWDGASFVLRKANAGAEQITEGKIGSLLGTTADQMFAIREPQILSDMHTCFSTKDHLVREMRYNLESTGLGKYLEVHYVFVPPDEVLVHTVDLTARREAELALQKSYEEMEQRVVERTRELADLNEQLRVEREALSQKNAAMRELITQINEGKRTLAESIQTNLQRITLPILDRLGTRLDEPGRNYLQMLRDSLDDILSPHLADLHKHHPYLTAHEIDLCNLIKSGLTCKEIAGMRGRSEQTILKQRKLIRKKLGLTDEKINLRNYLASWGVENGKR